MLSGGLEIYFNVILGQRLGKDTLVEFIEGAGEALLVLDRVRLRIALGFDRRLHTSVPKRYRRDLVLGLGVLQSASLRGEETLGRANGIMVIAACRSVTVGHLEINVASEAHGALQAFLLGPLLLLSEMVPGLLLLDS